MASFNLVLATAARCERASGASWRFWICQPGRFAQGPDEKYGRAGRTAGVIGIIPTILSDGAFRWGKVSHLRVTTDGPRGQAEDPTASAWPLAGNLLAVLLRSSSLPFTIESLA